MACAQPSERGFPGPRWLATLVAAVSSSLPGLVLLVLGTLLEALALSRGRENVYTAGGLTAPVALASLAWEWLTIAWVATALTRAATSRTAGWSRAARRTLLAVLVLLGEGVAFAYLMSWAYYLRTGQFASWEAVRFILASPPGSDEHISSIFASELVRALALAAVFLLLVPPFLVWLARARPWPWAGGSDVARRRRYAWYACGFVTGGLLIALKRDEAETRVGLRLDTLRRRTSPAITLGFTLAETLWAEGITPCLETAELRPRSTPWRPGPVPAGARTIVFVKLESARADSIGRGLMPVLDALAARSRVFTHAYANATHTNDSDPSVHSSLYPIRTREHHYYRATDPWPRALLHDLLHEGGYRTAIFSSEDLRWGRMDLFLRTPGLDRLDDAAATTAPARVDGRDSGYAAEVRAGAVRGNVEDRDTVSGAIEWLKTCQGQPAFVALDLQRTHFPYDVHEGVASESDADVSFLSYPMEKTAALRASYDGALRGLDAEVGRFLAALAEQGRLESSIVVIYGDHGQFFQERPGYVTHAREPYELLARVPCIVHAPALLGPGVDDYPLELVDLAPTVLGLLGWEPHPSWQGTALLGPARTPLADRAVYLVCDSPIAVADGIVLAGRWKLIRNRNRGTQELYDLETDPEEKTDLAAREPARASALARRLETWRRRQLAYHAFDFYYERFFAPRPVSGH